MFRNEISMTSLIVAVSRLLKLIIGLAFIFAAVGPASAQEFFKGKTVVVLVGTAAGGEFDTYSRMLARHIGKHLSGNPNVVVQNMPGAGQLIAANHLYNRASRDGLTIAIFPAR
jgi:tripartite-type tricarboxylate transporter receptor subunit TctC